MFQIAFRLISPSLVALAGCGFSFCEDQLTGLDESAPSTIISNACLSGLALGSLVVSAQPIGDATCRAVDLNDLGLIADVECAERFDFANFSNPPPGPVAQSPNHEFTVAYQYSEPADGVLQFSLIVVDRLGQQRGEIRFASPAESFEPVGVTSDGAHVLGVQYPPSPGDFNLVIVRVSDATVVDRHAIASAADYSLPLAFATVDLHFIVYEVRPSIGPVVPPPGLEPAIRLWDRQSGADIQLN